MSDQLYRWNGPRSDKKMLVRGGLLVPVEPCVHGKIDEHEWMDGGDTFVGDGGQWLDPANYTKRTCMGAALKGADDA